MPRAVPARRAVKRTVGAIAALLVLAGGWAAWGALRSRPDPQPIGLFTTLPILWQESADLAGLLRTDAPPHWARSVLAGNVGIRPLDRLTALDRSVPLIVVAQPRPLAPDENVALDQWVRAGGRVLLFADPMLTQHTLYPLGDKRRPQDVVLLSPILTRWGLGLRFDEEQPAGEHSVEMLGGAAPVNLPGEFARAGKGCTLQSDGLVADCRIGRGRVLAVADASLFEGEGAETPVRARALNRLLTELRDSR